MSDTVDKRVVEMRFDNQQFESRTKTTLGTLEKLKNALNFSHASDGLDKLSKHVNGVNMNPLASAAGAVQVSFSKMEAVALTALTNIVNRAVDAGVALVKSLTIAPISQGFGEYELKMGSIQTIMASTGESLDTVNGYLEELNRYADKTIYSFSDMTSNIGKFTNAGVKLEDSVKAIQGVSNVAAVSGANANEASRAMYNFAQALSAGYVKLIDWKSIENANMATVEFKDQLLQTALAMGTVVKEGDMYRSVTTDLNGKTSALFDATHMFNDSLSAQWMTTDVLVQALNNYSTDIRTMSEAEVAAYEEKLRSIGYTEEQIKQIEELGKKAFDSAQDVKTFSQLMDTLKESVGSGWAQTFEIIFGDFEEAKRRWTAVNEEIGGMLQRASDARNALLEEAFGVPDSLVNKQTSSWEAVQTAIEAAGIPLDDFIQKCLELGGKGGEGVTSIEDFKASLTSGWLTGDIVSQAIDSFIGPVNEAGDTAETVGRTFEDFKRIIDETWGGKWGVGEGRWEAYTAAGWDADAMQKAVNKSGQGLELTYEDYQAALTEVTDEQLRAAGYTDEQIQQLRVLQEQYAGVNDAIDETAISTTDLRSGSELLLDGLAQGWNAIKGIFSAMKQGWEIAFPSMTAERLYSILEAFNSLATRFNEWVGNANETRKNPMSITAQNIRYAFAGLASVVGIGLDALKEVAGFMVDTFSESVISGVNKVLSFASSIGQLLISLRTWIQETGIIRKGLDWLYDKVIAAKDAFVEWFNQFKELPIVQRLISAGQTVINKFVSMITSLFPQAAEKAGTLIEAIKNIWKTKNFSGAIDVIKSFASALKDDFIAAWEKIKSSKFFGPIVDGLKSIWTAITTLDTTSLTGWASDAYNAIKDFLQPVFDFFSGIKDKLTGAAEDANTGFQSIGTVIGNAATYLKDHFFAIIAAFALFIGAATIYKFIRFVINIARMIFSPVQTIVGAIDSFASAAKGAKQALTGFAIVEAVAAIAALAFVVVEVGKVPQEQLDRGMGVVVILGVIVGAIIGLVSTLFNAKSKLKPKSVKDQVASMFKIVELAGAIFLVALALEKVVNVIKTSSLGQLVGGIAIIVGVVVAMFVLSKKLSQLKGTGGIDIAKPVLAIAAAVYILCKAFEDILDAITKEGVTDGKIAWALGIVVVMTIAMGVIAAALAKISKSTGNASSIGKIGGGVLAVAMAVKVLVGAIQDITELDFSKWGAGQYVAVVGIIAAMGAIMYALSKMPASAGVNGVGILGVSLGIEFLALAIKTLGSLDEKQIKQGLVAVGAMMLFMAIFTKLTAKGSELGGKSAVAFLGMSASILILSGAIVLLSLLKPEDVLLGTVAISAMLIAVGIMMKLSSSAKDLKMSTFLGISLVIGVLTAAIAVMSFLDEGKVLVATLALDSLLICVGVMMKLASKAQELKVTQFLGLSVVIATLAGSVWLIASLDSGVAKAVVAIGAMEAMFVLFSTALAKAGASFQDVGTKGLVGLGVCVAIIGVLAVIVAALASIPNVDAAITVATVMSLLMAGLGVAMIGFASVAKIGANGSILAGLGGMLGIIGIVALVIAAIVALNELCPGISEAINNALPLFASLGGAIGAAIGGLISGLLGGFDLSGLVEDMGTFGDAMKTFADNASGITDEAANGVKAIATMLLALAGGDLMNAITSLLGGGTTSLSDFSAQLPQFGTDLGDFVTNLGENFDATKMSDAATAAKDLTTMVTNLPRSGGWLQKIIGEPTSLAQFGENICTLATKLCEFCKTIKEDENFDAAIIEDSATAAGSLVDLVNNLPSRGGWLQKIIGAPETIESFSSGITAFGTAIHDICGEDSLGGLDEGATDCIGVAVSAATELVNLEKALPEEDNFFEKIFGGGQQDFEGFKTQAKAFGGAIQALISEDEGVGFLTSIADVNCVTIAKTAAEKLLALGANEWFVADNDALSDLGWEIQDFGTWLKLFYDDMAEVDVTRLSSLATGFETLITSLATASGLNTTAIGTFSDALSSLATSGISDFCSALNDSNTDVTTAVDTFLGYATDACVADVETFTTCGTDCVFAYLTAFSDIGFQSDATTAAESLVDSVISALEVAENKFKPEGKTSAENYLKEIQNQSKAAISAGKDLVASVVSGISKDIQKFKTAGSNAASSFVSGISGYSSSAYNTGASIGTSAKNGLGSTATTDAARTYGRNFVDGFIKGMQDNQNKAYDAAYEVGKVALRGIQKAINSHSPSKETEKTGGYFGIGYVSGILKYITQAEDAALALGQATVDGLNKAISRVPEFLTGELTFDPVIRPVVDLSNAQASVATLNDMFNRSVGVEANVAAVTGSAVSVAKVRTMGGNAFQNGEAVETATTTQAPTMYNTFNITSNNPEEVANVVSRRLQKQVERKEAVWAQSSGTKSPLVRSPS